MVLQQFVFPPVPIYAVCFKLKQILTSTFYFSLFCLYGPCVFPRENIFQLTEAELRSSHIPRDNCLRLGCDNANVMMGRHKGVYAFVKDKQPSVFLSGCCLHMVHNCGKKAAANLPPMETALIDIFYYFNKSSDWKQRFKGTQEVYERWILFSWRLHIFMALLQSSVFWMQVWTNNWHIFCTLLEHKMGPFGPLKLLMQTFKNGIVWIVDNSNITLSGNLHNSKYQLFWKKCLWCVKYAHFVFQVTIVEFYILGFNHLRWFYV